MLYYLWPAVAAALAAAVVVQDSSVCDTPPRRWQNTESGVAADAEWGLLDSLQERGVQLVCGCIMRVIQNACEVMEWRGKDK